MMTKSASSLCCTVLLVAGMMLVPVSAYGPWGLAKSPPMGWRTWTAYTTHVSQSLMEEVMDKMANRSRLVDGKPTSLIDLGFNHVGLDDGWQACGTGVNGSFHDSEGRPLVNTTLFPSMLAMNQHAHSLGLRSLWYENNCVCNERGFTDPTFIQKVYDQSVAAIVEYQYDGVKLDGCSQWKNISLWASLTNATDRDITIENAHNGPVPTDPDEECDFDWFRSSGDAWRAWPVMWKNLQSVLPYLANSTSSKPLSRPSCWAYPDMMQVGNFVGEDTFLQNRAHFGAWCIVSSPLILAYDMRDDSITDAIWPIVSNKEAVAVNQQWAGSPMLVKSVSFPQTPTETGPLLVAMPCNKTDSTMHGFKYSTTSQTISTPDGMCVDSTNTTQVHVTTCNAAAATQKWTIPAAGQYGLICSVANPKACIGLNMYDGYPGGPQVEVTTTSPSYFMFNSDTTVEQRSFGQCFARRQYIPAPAGVDTQFQVFTKPQPGGAMAVFVLSNRVPDNMAVEFTLEEIGLGGASAASVRDVWNQMDLPAVTNGKFATDAFGAIDSRFYVFTPQ